MTERRSPVGPPDDRAADASAWDVELAETDSADEELLDDAFSPAERARMRRRDHDASARERELMNDGSAKWFRQALDRRERSAREGRGRRAAE
jgi:hypothetical protein